MRCVMPPFADGDLQGLLREAGLEARLAGRLARYGALVLDANRGFNLTGARSAPELVPQLLDSLSIVPYLQEPYVDLGSGAGFPAIPVALATGIAVVMVESAAKKARFLQSVLQTLELTGQVVDERAELAGRGQGMRECFASGTARAVGPAPTVAELLLPFIRVGGIAVLQRGNRDQSDGGALEDAALMLGASVEREEELPAGHRVILLRKHTSTPDRFPRRVGIPAKRPLCS
jgi:16S rRNA (guanine527-N7)-methyltransferase